MSGGQREASYRNKKAKKKNCKKSTKVDTVELRNKYVSKICLAFRAKFKRVFSNSCFCVFYPKNFNFVEIPETLKKVKRMRNLFLFDLKVELITTVGREKSGKNFRNSKLFRLFEHLRM